MLPPDKIASVAYDWMQRLGLFLEESGLSVGESPCALTEDNQGPDDCYVYYSMAFNMRKGMVPGEILPPALALPLHSAHVFIQPVPVFVRPKIIGILEMLRQSRILLHFLDPDYVSHMGLCGIAGNALSLVKIPGTILSNIDCPSFDENLTSTPRLVYFANFKGSASDTAAIVGAIKGNPKVMWLWKTLMSSPASDPVLLASQAFEKDPGTVLRSREMASLLSKLVQYASDYDRFTILNVVKKFPSTIYTSLASGQIKSKHPLCEIRAPIHYRDLYNSIRPGDIIPCHLPWRMKNAFSERCCTVMYRGAFPLVPNIGSHVRTFEDLGLGGCLYDMSRPETLVDAIGSLLAAKPGREPESLRVHRYAMENFSEKNYFQTVFEGINKLMAAKEM